MSLQIESNARAGRAAGPAPLLDIGFRPFFLLGGLYAAIGIAAWVASLSGALPLPASWPSLFWHGHEMLFGFAAAVISGFLLTAVPGWTGTQRVRGAWLAILVAAWLLGRLALWLAGLLPPAAVALLDLLHLPLLTFFVARPVYLAGKAQNYAFPVLLSLLFAANLLVHGEILGLWSGTARFGLVMGTYAVVLMVTIIGGRVVPAFTRNALRRRGQQADVQSSELFKSAAMIAMLIAMTLELLLLTPWSARPLFFASGIASLSTALLLLLRARGWRVERTLGEPIVWVLHAGQAWLVVAFLIGGLSRFIPAVPGNTAFHALSAGAIGTMTIAFMTRAALGHTGRPLQASPAIVLAYGLVIGGAAVRVLLPMAFPQLYRELLIASGTLWAGGFAIYSVVFFPILTGPTLEAEPG
ncbi:MAG: NnrS family protein [Deltaproteobacteria bacterium]|nr:NnrS family protein [Deltaproteobacteria bacterium]